MNFGPSGNKAIPWWGKLLIGAGVIIGLGILTAVTGGAAGVIFGAGFYGALTGAVSGAVISGGIGLITGGIDGMLDGIGSGFMMGAIIGGASGMALSGINIATGGVKIIGSAQVNSATFFHRMASNIQAGKMAMQIGRYSTISLNSKLKTVGLNGGGLRPDVIGISRIGSSKIIEVTSASQTAAQMIAKCEGIVALNPGLTYSVINWAGWIGRILF